VGVGVLLIVAVGCSVVVSVSDVALLVRMLVMLVVRCMMFVEFVFY